MSHTAAPQGARAPVPGGLAALRAAILILLGVLLQPTLLVISPFLNGTWLDLVDDSRSMTIADNGQLTRGDQVRGLLAPTRRCRRHSANSSSSAEPRFARGRSASAGPMALAFAGNRSDLATALDEVRREMAAMPLAGLVLVTDGADNADSAITRAVL